MAKDNHEVHEVYVIPPNFIDTGTIMGGMFKMRNAIEAVVLGLGIGFPVFQIPAGLTTRIIVLCLTALPLVFLALVGIANESLTAFAWSFIKHLLCRRIIYREDSMPQDEKRHAPDKQRKKTKRSKKDFDDEFEDEDMPAYKSRKRKAKKEGDDTPRLKYNPSKAATLEEFLPILKIEGGLIHTKDGRFVKIMEIAPINFLLRSAREQMGIIYSFVSYLKISPVKIHLKVIAKKPGFDKHLERLKQQLESEHDEKCRVMQQDQIEFIRSIGMKEAVARRFFLIFEYEPMLNSKNATAEEAYSQLEGAAQTVKTYFRQCGNTIVEPDNVDEFHTEVLYTLLNRQTSLTKRLQDRIAEVAAQHIGERGEVALNDLPVNSFIVPESVDLTNGHLVQMDGLYYAFLLIPSDGYKTHVNAGWTSLLINAGEGIDVDFFLIRQPKERIVQKLGQQLRINRSKIRETSDTNTDHDDLESAIASGYFLKEGVANNQDFYYLSTMITITAATEEDLEWRVNEMKKVMISQDLHAMRCNFRGEQALLSTLPLVHQDKALYQKSRRNVLSMGAGSIYPFVSYEMSDENGILMGVNQHNNSLVMMDIFNTEVYKNANIGLIGTSGAGKTTLIQLIALRFRRKHVQTFIVAPLKGHEFKRACDNVSGAFISISPASKTCINIMEIRKTDRTSSELLDGLIERSELSYKIQRLHVFFSLLIPDMSHEERQLLDDALIKTYAAKGITQDNNSLVDPMNPAKYKEMPILGDVHTILVKQPETKRMANILNRLVNGSAKNFNQQTNVDLSNLYTVLDLSDLASVAGAGDPGSLLVLGMFVAVDFIWDKAREDRTVEKCIMIDEVWQLIGANSNPLAADTVLEFAKVIRGFGGSALFATQDINDFFSLQDGKFGKGVLNNCKTKIILQLEEEEAQRVEGILKLSETEMLNVTRFERGSGLIKANSNTITVDFKASKLELDLITTDRIQLRELVAQKQSQPMAPSQAITS